MTIPLLHYNLGHYVLGRGITVHWQTLLQCQTIHHLQTPLMWKTPMKHKEYRIGLKGTKPILERNTNHPWMKK
ncbi:hypothetical protein HanIR_Chr08g0350831 [Helianthus annuus]|nr:hypothetical protein HanIR_Chr08g0350831 [Helianthus annuus]